VAEADADCADQVCNECPTDAAPVLGRLRPFGAFDNYLQVGGTQPAQREHLSTGTDPPWRPATTMAYESTLTTPVGRHTVQVMRAEDARFLAMVTPALTIASVVLRSRGRTGVMRTPQREFLSRCGPWATPALGAWMATATGLTVVAPLLLTRRGADEHAARSTVRPIASLLAVQVALEGTLGVISDKSHPISGAAFSLYRLGQLRRARAAVALDNTPRVRDILRLQTWFWRANVLMLLITVVARTVMPPGAESSGG
jgi:hypothetical protein